MVDARTVLQQAKLRDDQATLRKGTIVGACRVHPRAHRRVFQAVLQGDGGESFPVILHTGINESFYGLPTRWSIENAAQEISPGLFGTVRAKVERHAAVDDETIVVMVQKAIGNVFSFSPGIIPSALKDEPMSKIVTALMRLSSQFRRPIEEGIIERLILGDHDDKFENWRVELNDSGWLCRLINIDLDGAFSLMRFPVWRDDDDLSRELTGAPLLPSTISRISQFIQRITSEQMRAQVENLGLEPRRIDAMVSRACWFENNKVFPPLVSIWEFTDAFKGKQ